MKQVTTISLDELMQMAGKTYGGLVKADVDVEKKILIVDMDLHADGEAFLLEHGSAQRDIWGINLYAEKLGSDEFIEFDSMINMRPSQGNASRDVLDESIRETIKMIVNEAVHA